MWAALAGLLLTWARADHRLADALADHNENKVSRVVLRVASLPDLEGGGRQFQAQVISSIPDGVPSRIQVSWPTSAWVGRSEEHTSELQSLMRTSYAVFCLKKK